MAAITCEFLVRNNGDADVIASVTNDAGVVAWTGEAEIVERLQRMVADAGIDLNDPAQMAVLKDRFGYGSYFSVGYANQ